MSHPRQLTSDDIDAYRCDVRRLEGQLCEVLIGQDALVAEVVTGVLAGGHLLLEGLPGLGKTQLVKGLARALDRPLARVQCTPDLLPADVTGSEILIRRADGGREELRFEPGPIFASLVLVDEINRATPRSQSALLEAMQEGQVTQGRRTHPLPRPFWVIATQNPIELEGTYPLPEAQLDRFFFHCRVPNPSDEALFRIAESSLDAEPADRIESLFPAGRLEEMLTLAREVVIADALKKDAVALVRATWPEAGAAPARAHLRYGASPRALQTLLRAARVRALSDGRAHVALEDLRALALPALRHRLLLRVESELDGVSVDHVIEEVVSEWARRR